MVSSTHPPINTDLTFVQCAYSHAAHCPASAPIPAGAVANATGASLPPLWLPLSHIALYTLLLLLLLPATLPGEEKVTQPTQPTTVVTNREQYLEAMVVQLRAFAEYQAAQSKLERSSNQLRELAEKFTLSCTSQKKVFDPALVSCVVQSTNGANGAKEAVVQEKAGK